MKHQFNITRSVRMILITISILISLTGCRCQYGDPAVSITVVNQTDQTLDIHIDGLRESDVSPKASIKFTTIAISPVNVYSEDQKFLIEAKKESGETIYSQNFTWQELDNIDWTIVILESEG